MVFFFIIGVFRGFGLVLVKEFLVLFIFKVSKIIVFFCSDFLVFSEVVNSFFGCVEWVKFDVID